MVVALLVLVASLAIRATGAILSGKITSTNSAENPHVYIGWRYTDAGTNAITDWAHQEYMGTTWSVGQTLRI